MKRLICITLILFSAIVSGIPALSNPWGEEVYPKVDVELNRNISNKDSDLPELKGMDQMVLSYLNAWKLKGASISVIRNDSLIFAKGFGWADVEKREQMQPYHLLRMASVSKLITAAGIMSLVDRGMLELDRKVFGKDGILTGGIYDKVASDTSYCKITVEHLLRHEGGFILEPVFSLGEVRRGLGITGKVSGEDVIRYAFTKGLRFQPGESQNYSNLGFLLLSKIIERISGCEYEEYIQENIFKPIGCTDMHIGGTYLAERYKGEVRYYSHSDAYVAYGGNNLALCSGAGGWCGSTMELAKFVAAIDGKPQMRDVISVMSVQEMTEYFPESPQKFALGWNDTNPEKGWVRTGSLAGTTAFIKYFPDGECWIFIANTSTFLGPALSKETAKLFDRCREKFSSCFPKRNMFYYN